MQPSQHFEPGTVTASIAFVLVAALAVAGVFVGPAYARDPSRTGGVDATETVRPSVSSLMATFDESPDGLGLKRVADLLTSRGTPNTEATSTRTSPTNLVNMPPSL